MLNYKIYYVQHLLLFMTRMARISHKADYKADKLSHPVNSTLASSRLHTVLCV